VRHPALPPPALRRPEPAIRAAPVQERSYILYSQGRWPGPVLTLSLSPFLSVALRRASPARDRPASNRNEH